MFLIVNEIQKKKIQNTKYIKTNLDGLYLTKKVRILHYSYWFIKLTRSV